CRTGSEGTLSAANVCRISAALRQGSNCGSDFVGVLVIRNEHHRRDASLFSIAVQFPKLASGACRTRRCERALCLVQPARQVELAKGHENQSRLCHTRHDRERGDRTSSGEVEADKLAGPAHALLSE